MIRTKVFDTETTGLPSKSPKLEMQPHLMQLAISLYDEERRPCFELSTLVRLPKGVEPHPKAFEVHGISAEMCNDLGMPLQSALRLFQFASQRCQITVAHNIEFDTKIMQWSAERADMELQLVNPFCTCIAATEVLQLPPTEAMLRWGHGGKFKKANLGECWKFFFDEELSGAHDALVDTRGAARVFFELEDRGLLAKQ